MANIALWGMIILINLERMERDATEKGKQQKNSVEQHLRAAQKQLPTKAGGCDRADRSETIQEEKKEVVKPLQDQ
jgi:hypothetical protein